MDQSSTFYSHEFYLLCPISLKIFHSKLCTNLTLNYIFNLILKLRNSIVKSRLTQKYYNQPNFNNSSLPSLTLYTHIHTIQPNFYEAHKSCPVATSHPHTYTRAKNTHWKKKKYTLMSSFHQRWLEYDKLF